MNKHVHKLHHISYYLTRIMSEHEMSTTLSFLGQMVHLKINTADQLCKMKSCMWDEMTHLLYRTAHWFILQIDDQRESNDIQSISKTRRTFHALALITVRMIFLQPHNPVHCLDVSTAIPYSDPREHRSLHYISWNTSCVYIEIIQYFVWKHYKQFMIPG